MRILVTGAHGFLGQHIMRELLAEGHAAVGTDRHHIDLLDPRAGDALRPILQGAQLCLHLAAKVGRLSGEDDPVRTIMDNAGITTVVAQACAATGTQLAYASTSEVYGDLGDAVAYEDGRRMALPHNLYGLSKRWGEEACRLYAPDGLVLLRFSMPYGPGHPPGRGRAALTNILDQADRNQPIPIHRDSERSWCWVGDTARATRMILEAAAEQPRWHGGAWNVGRDDNATPMLEIAEKACDLVGAPRALIKLVDPPGRQTVVKRLSTDRLRRLGWEPIVDIDDGMRRVLEYVRSLPRELHSTTEGVR